MLPIEPPVAITCVNCTRPHARRPRRVFRRAITKNEARGTRKTGAEHLTGHDKARLARRARQKNKHVLQTANAKTTRDANAVSI